MADDTKPSANADAGNMDDFFEEMFGQRPKKRGKGYELLVAAAIKLSGFASNVSADRFIKGEFSETTYQLDAHVEDGAGAFVEAKDYTEKRDFAGAPVGRGDVQKLAGALLDSETRKGHPRVCHRIHSPDQEVRGLERNEPEGKADSSFLMFVAVCQLTKTAESGRSLFASASSSPTTTTQSGLPSSPRLASRNSSRCSPRGLR